MNPLPDQSESVLVITISDPTAGPYVLLCTCTGLSVAGVCQRCGGWKRLAFDEEQR